MQDNSNSVFSGINEQLQKVIYFISSLKGINSIDKSLNCNEGHIADTQELFTTMLSILDLEVKEEELNTIEEILKKQYSIGIEKVSSLCHQANKNYCHLIGDDSQCDWASAYDWQKEGTINGVKLHLEADISPEQSHQSWMEDKINNSWIYGKVKDGIKKTHPLLVPYNEMPEEQKIKDYIFKSICDYFRLKINEDANK